MCVICLNLIIEEITFTKSSETLSCHSSLALFASLRNSFTPNVFSLSRCELRLQPHSLTFHPPALFLLFNSHPLQSSSVLDEYISRSVKVNYTLNAAFLRIFAKSAQFCTFLIKEQLPVWKIPLTAKLNLLLIDKTAPYYIHPYSQVDLCLSNFSISQKWNNEINRSIVQHCASVFK